MNTYRTKLVFNLALIKMKLVSLKSYLGGFFTICVIICAAPYVLMAFGVLRASTDAYRGSFLAVSLVGGVLAMVGYILWKHSKKKKMG